MPRVLVLALLLSGLAHPTNMQDPVYTSRLIEFNNAFNVYFRTYMGCPKGALGPEDCNFALGGTDYAAHIKVMKLAHKLWPQDKQQ